MNTNTMNTYAIFRRNAWQTPQDLEVAAARSTQVGNEEMPDQVRWIRSYVVADREGRLGPVCIPQPPDPASVVEHAGRADLPADEVLPVVNTVIVRPDPVTP